MIEADKTETAEPDLEAPKAGDSPREAGGEQADTNDPAASPDESPDNSPDESPDESPEASVEELNAQLNEATAENTRLQDGLLRARAEVENIRRRSQNEAVAARKFAIEGFARELLGVRDSLEQASSVELEEGAGAAVQQMKDGLGLTLKQLDIAMARFAVVEVEAGPGVRFDPERHQAISTTPSGEIEADHIVSVVQKGFLLKERLLRPAMVVVAAKDDGGGPT